MAEHAHLIDMPEAVGVFDDLESLETAIDELQMAGFPRFHISLLADEKSVEEKLGESYWRVEDLEDEPDAPRAAFLSEESLGAAEGGLIGIPLYVVGAVTMGALVPAVGIAGAISAAVIVGGAGAALGGVLAKRLGDRHAKYYRTQIDHGGLLLWVRLADEAHKTKALEILKRNSGRDVHVHEWSTP